MGRSVAWPVAMILLGSCQDLIDLNFDDSCHSQHCFRFIDSLSLREVPVGFLGHFLAQREQAGLSNRLIARAVALIQKFGNFQDSAWDSFPVKNKTYPDCQQPVFSPKMMGLPMVTLNWRMNVQVGYLVLTCQAEIWHKIWGYRHCGMGPCLGHPAARYFANGAAIGGSTNLCTTILANYTKPKHNSKSPASLEAQHGVQRNLKQAYVVYTPSGRASAQSFPHLPQSQMCRKPLILASFD